LTSSQFSGAVIVSFVRVRPMFILHTAPLTYIPMDYAPRTLDEIRNSMLTAQ
jgi:hypothetical protein